MMNAFKNAPALRQNRIISYARWGYLFITPFFVAFVLFSLIPLCSTIYYSFFQYYRSGLKVIGPTFIGLANYKAVFASDLPKYLWNTLLIWIMGFIPQLVISMLLAAWFTNLRLRLRAKGIFKTIIYMPNLIMASALAMLFFALFAENGPINSSLISLGIVSEPYQFFTSVASTRWLIAFMNFLMWVGNTMILIMAGIMGIDSGLFEAAEIDGCKSGQMFWRITLPLIRPILIYVLITSMIGGLQMFDVPKVLTNNTGSPNRSTTTILMYLNNHLYSKNYGMAGAVSVILFLICAVLCIGVFVVLTRPDDGLTRKERRLMKKAKGGGGKL